MIHYTETIIFENRDCDFDGHECCMDVTLAYDKDTSVCPYHLYVVLFDDFEKETWHETKEGVIKELKELDERFNSNIIDDYETLEKIEAFVKPDVKEEE